jgi:hypothetical protein
VKNDASVRDDDTEKTIIAVKKLQSIELKNCPQNGNGETEQTMATRRSKKAFFVLLCLVTKRSRQETSGPIGDTVRSSRGHFIRDLGLSKKAILDY